MNCTNECNPQVPPPVLLEDVVNSKGVPLSEILNRVNHLYLPYKNRSNRDTRLQVPPELRRKGLWITYIKSKEEVVTEWYSSCDIRDAAFSCSSNWKSYLNKELIKEVIEQSLSWYKV